METIRCSLGIMAHNEEANIGRLLARVRESRFPWVAIAEVLVITSGCTDRSRCSRQPAPARVRVSPGPAVYGTP